MNESVAKKKVATFIANILPSANTDMEKFVKKSL